MSAAEPPEPAGGEMPADLSPAEQILWLRRAGRHDEACALAASLAAGQPEDAELQYQAACVHDFLGREAQAVPYYLAALSGELSDAHRRSACLGLGSTYRALGRYPLAERTLREGLARFPGAPELEVFLAMTLHNLGQSKPAVEMLLRVLAQTSGDAQVQGYREAIRFYAQDVDKAWPEVSNQGPATTVLRPMTEPEYAAWVAEVVPAYAQDKVASGQWPAAEAVERSAQEFRELLPLGLGTADNLLYTIEDDERRAVGMLWFAVQTRSGRRIAYVYDVSVRPECQRRGHALRAFQALEVEALRLGLSGIALHVFGHNTGARELYARLGFEPTNLSLFKPLASGPRM